MDKASIKPGSEYALREKRQAGESFQRVRVLLHVRGNKWKVEWLDPNPGLVDYVTSSNLIVAWKEHKAFLKDEGREQELRSHNEGLGYVRDSPMDNALYEIFESTGGEVSYYQGKITAPPDALERLRVRCRLDPTGHSHKTYLDRHGSMNVAFDEVLQIARAFCAAEPATVLAGVEATERKWSQEARTPGEEHMVSLLNEYRAAWALIRQWTGHDPAIAAREDEIKKLERLVWDAIYALQKAGLDKEAARLRRAIGRE